MDKVVSKQTQFRRALEKQLEEIEVSQHQNEARRLKQIRDLGVDLSRIQTTTRDLESIDDLRPPHEDLRRGSVPAVTGLLSLNLEPTFAPRRTRRISCIAMAPLASPESDDLPEFPTPERRLSDTEKGEQLLVAKESVNDLNSISSSTNKRRQIKDEAIFKNPEIKSSKSLLDKCNFKTAEADSKRLQGRRGSNGDITNTSNNNGHNVTTAFEHKYKSTNLQDSMAGNELADAETQSMFESVKKRGRRASEPAVGGHFVRSLQEKVTEDVASFRQRLAFDSGGLKRSIQTNLPSNIVAEEDEDNDAEDISDVNEDETESSNGSLLTETLASETGNDIAQLKNGNGSNPSKRNRGAIRKNIISKINQDVLKTGEENFFRQRRSSDGGVMIHSFAKQLQREGRVDRLKSQTNSRAISAAVRSRLDKADDDTDEVWQDVRKCRYLRGYDPPDMKETGDVAEFVFGSERGDSSPPKLK